MALCTTMSSAFNETSLPYYPLSLNKLHEMYRKTRTKTTLDTDLANQIQLAEKLVRSLSVEGFLRHSTKTKLCSRRISLIGRQTSYEEAEELPSTTILNDLQFFSISDDNENRHYSTKKPYPSPSKRHYLSSPPHGYKPISIQLLARHGSRALTNRDYDIEILQIWQLAKEKNLLTTLGEQLEEDTKLFMIANNHVGRGQLTSLGRQEHFELGTRLYHRLKSLFNSSNQINVVTSGKKRAVDSSEEFINGLIQSDSTLSILKLNPNKDLLYFHKSCIDYIQFKKNDLQVKTKLELIKNCQRTKEYARQVLQRIYQDEFIDLLINQNYLLSSENQMKNEVDIVLSLYAMFVVAPAHSELRMKRMLAKYFNEEQSNWFAYIHDAEEFYLKGPSIEGTTITYDMAKPLLFDFFSSVNAIIQGQTNATVHLRFAHAETIIPFATLLKIPGLSNEAVHNLNVYNYETNQWRGDQVAPMAANVQWEIYQHENNSNQILVRMLYNEMEVRFKDNCQPLTNDSFFYDWNELQRAYADIFICS